MSGKQETDAAGALTGRQEAADGLEAMSAEELKALSCCPSGLLARFCEEIGGAQAEQKHMTLFLELLREIQEGGVSS